MGRDVSEQADRGRKNGAFEEEEDRENFNYVLVRPFSINISIQLCSVKHSR
jgi:hypothetical protein